MVAVKNISSSRSQLMENSHALFSKTWGFIRRIEIIHFCQCVPPPFNLDACFRRIKVDKLGQLQKHLSRVHCFIFFYMPYVLDGKIWETYCTPITHYCLCIFKIRTLSCLLRIHVLQYIYMFKDIISECYWMLLEMTYVLVTQVTAMKHIFNMLHIKISFINMISMD